MNPLKKLPLSSQLYGMAAAILLSMGALVALLIVELGNTSKTLAYTVENRMMPIDRLNGMSDSFLRSRDAVDDVLGKSRTPAQVVDEIDTLIAGLQGQWDKYRATEMSSEEKKLADATNPHIAEGLGLVRELQERLKRGDTEGLAEWRTKVLRPDLQDLSQRLGKLADLQVANAVVDKDSAAAEFARVRKIIVGALLLALAMSTTVAVLIVRNTMRMLGADPRKASEAASRIATGDLEFEMAPGQGGTDSLMGRLRQMKASLLHSKLDYEGQLTCISRMQAVIEFAPDGTITTANDNFLRAMGYSLEEVRGKHHRLFVDPAERSSADYARFWESLGRGEALSGQFRRIDHAGREVWLQGIYSPIVDQAGKPFKVVKYATVVTEQRAAAALNAAFKGALDKLGANVVVANNDFEIIYLNEAGRRLFTAIQGDLGKELTSLNASRLVGSSIDVLSTTAAEHRRLYAGLTNTHVEEKVIGGRTVRVTVNPMKDDTERRLGTVLEWVDRTAEVQAEAEIHAMVGAVTAGDLGTRISLEGKAGFFANLSSGLNQLVVTMDRVVREVQTLVDAANAGDLTRRVPVEEVPGLQAKIGTGINQLTERMAGVISQVKDAATEVNRAADEISQGNTDLSQRTEEQASSLEETASSMEQMTSTVRQNADNAGQANQLAIAARDQAERGGEVVSKAVAAMSEINGASKKIADIISVIDEIAFQTNLLALNAAVEAARAGEQGRGFAVVATEVRNLAGRSATAAKEIKALIHDSVRKVGEGAELVTQSGATLEQIVGAVKKVTDIVAEIAAASQEQSAGIEQVNKAVMQLDELTQQNAALVEQASAASQSMADQARALNGTMARYTVTSQAHGSRQDTDAVKPAREPERRSLSNRRPSKPGATRGNDVLPPTQRKVAVGDSTWTEF